MKLSCLPEIMLSICYLFCIAHCLIVTEQNCSCFFGNQSVTSKYIDIPHVRNFGHIMILFCYFLSMNNSEIIVKLMKDGLQ